MNLIKMLEEQEKDYILLVRCGAFFVGVGKNAIYLSEIFDLKLTCITGNTCKIGIPVDSIYKYIDKTEKYVEYMLQIILKLPRTEKFSIGTEYKTSMYKMMQDILYISKIGKILGDLIKYYAKDTKK